MIDYGILFILLSSFSGFLTKGNLRRGYIVSIVFGSVMIIKLLGYIVIVKLIKIYLAPFNGFGDFSRVDILQYVFLGLAVADFGFLYFIRKITVKKLEVGDLKKEEIVGKLLNLSLIIYALCESIAIYGLILFLLAGNSLNFYIFLILCLVCSGIYFPRYGQWEKWANLQEDRKPKPIWGVTVFVVFFALWIVVEVALNGGKALLYQGIALLEEDRYDQAIAYFNKAIEINPRYSEAYYNRGHAYQEKGLSEKAISDYNKAIELNPRLAEAYNNRGRVYDGKGQYDKAISDYNKAIEIDPFCTPCYVHRGNAWDDKGNLDRAIANYNKAIELDPASVIAYTERGVAYASSGNYQRAIQDCNKAIELDPNAARAYKSRGDIFFYQSRFALAEADYETYLRIKPKDIYRILWLYITRERGGKSGLHELSDNVNYVDIAKWPGPVAYLFLERISPEELLLETNDDDQMVKKERQCEAYFYLGQYYLLKNDKETAAQMFKLCLETKVTSFVEYTGAKVELERMGLE